MVKHKINKLLLYHINQHGGKTTLADFCFFLKIKYKNCTKIFAQVKTRELVERRWWSFALFHIKIRGEELSFERPSVNGPFGYITGKAAYGMCFFL